MIRPFAFYLLLNALSTIPLNAQVPFQANRITNDSQKIDHPVMVFAVDFDLDGDIDVLSSDRSLYTKQLAWFENDGTNNFTKHDINTWTHGISTIEIVDLDGDGDMDIVTASFSDRVGWIENLGDGSFWQHPIATKSQRVSALYPTDIDSDGDIDIMAAIQGEDKLVYFENDGGQQFTEITIATDLFRLVDVVSGDFDGDNKNDIITIHWIYGNNTEILFHHNNGDQTFTPKKIGATLSRPSLLFITDLNNDNSIDIITNTQENAALYWLKNDGAGNFSEELISSEINDELRSIFAADINNDGNMDIITAVESSNEIAWFKNDGAETFTKNVISTNAERAQAVFAIDLDKDGINDVLSASFRDKKIAWYANDGDEVFSESPINDLISNTTPRFISATDIDADGDMDILSASDTAPEIVWHENDGNGNLLPHIITSLQYGVRYAKAVDIDGDGDNDILSTSSFDGSHKVIWYENDGNQQFETHLLTTQIRSPNSILSADIDHDNDMDILVGAYQNGIILFRNDGNQNFEQETILADIGIPNHIFALDFNKDGVTDIITNAKKTGNANNNLLWLEQEEIGTFHKHLIDTYDTGFKFIVRDINLDGYLDIFTSSGRFPNEYALKWHENDGNTTFSAHPIGEISVNSSSIETNDIDGDGDIDLIATQPYDKSIVWYENDGEEHFSEIHQVIPGRYIEPRGITSVDFDGDGDNDILVSSTGLEWYENLSIVQPTGTNSTQNAITSSSYPNPFSHETVITYNLSEESLVNIEVYNVFGQKVRTLLSEHQTEGNHDIEWTGRDVYGDFLAGGLYFLRINKNNQSETISLVLIR